MYSLTIETDDDFSVVYKDKIYTGEFSLIVADHEELRIIRDNLSGPYGSPTGGKCMDIKGWMDEIIRDRLNDFNIRGGNRTISWHYVSPEQLESEVAERGEYRAGYLDGLDASIRCLEEQRTKVLSAKEYFSKPSTDERKCNICGKPYIDCSCSLPYNELFPSKKDLQ